jgi:hypothetical protein
VSFSDYEKELLRCCAQHYAEDPDEVLCTDLPRFTELGFDKISPVLNRLIHFALIRGYSDKSIKVFPACLELVHAWDNPPLRNRWDEATKWFQSKWWSLPVLVFFVGLPAIVTWIGMVKTILDWCSIIKGGSPK